MNPLFQRLMRSALRLTRKGDLDAATASIQSALKGMLPTAPAANDPGVAPSPEFIDVAARDLGSGKGRAPEPAGGDAGERRAATGEFISGVFTGDAGTRDYKLFIPSRAGALARPLVVMLHGCTQDPDDFAAGTGMNDAARDLGFFVLYPAQSQQANPQRCWNWFKHNHQARGRGEPEILAGMTRDVMARHAIDPARVHVAGLSAGGAMAAILGDAYPELFAAVGVHSGLPTGIAKDLPSALGAMKRSGARLDGPASGVATIVFHGDADATVHPGNGDHVIAASVGAIDGEIEKGYSRGGRSYTRRVHRGPGGEVIAEQWVVHGAQHAWSGGRARGSYTDPHGPDATAEMVRFFMEHPHRAAAEPGARP